MTATTHTDREPWQKLRSNEQCEACGHRGYCMYNSGKVYCMFPDGKDGKQVALHAGHDKAGASYAIYRRTGAAAPDPIPFPRRDERPDWERPDPLACEILYTAIAARCVDNPTPDAAREADERRFGEPVADVRAVSDHFYIQHPDALIAWFASEGRTQDAKNAGILTKRGQLSPALLNRKVFAYRDERGRVKDLKGRAYDGSTPKVLSLAGSREERGAARTWYHHRRITDAAEHGGHLRIAGGHEKADALNLAVGATVGANEGQASDGMIAALVAAGIIVATIHADGEDPKEGKAISEGQRLALALGERLEAAGIAVRIAEPLRSPGEPKLDADTILRDHGPEALRDIDRRALPLFVYRQHLGDLQPQDAAQVAQLAAHVARLQEAVRTARDERDQAQEWNRLTFAALRAGGGGTPLMKKVGRAGLGLVVEWDARRHQGHDQIDPETGERWVEMDLGAAGENVGLGDDATGATLTFLCAEGLARKRIKWLTIENPTPGQFPRRKQLLVHFPQGTREAALAAIAALRPEITATVQPHGGKRTRCEKHPEAGTKTTITSVTTCAECGDVLESPPSRVEWHDTDGRRTDPPAPSGEVQPQDAGYKLTYSAETLDTPEPVGDLQPHLAVEPIPLDRHPRCENAANSAFGCVSSPDPGEAYCPDCLAIGWPANHARRVQPAAPTLPVLLYAAGAD